jgi:hypothetical protein
MKSSTVVLEVIGHPIKQSFSIEHAERLLSVHNSGWKLPENSKYSYSSTHGIKYISNKRAPKEV